MNFNILGKLNKKIILILVIVGILVVSLLVSTFAFDFLKKKENEELIKNRYKAKKVYNKAVKAILKAEKEHDGFDFDSSEYIQKNKNYCEQLYIDFRDNKNIKIAEPEIISDDFEGEELKPYAQKCPSTAIDPNYKFNDRLRQYSNKNAPGNYIAHYGFRVYKIDFDNKDDGIESNLFYSAGLFDKVMNQWRQEKYNMYDRGQGYDLYILYDFSKCKYMGGKTIQPMVDYFTRTLTGNLNGVIKHENHY